MTIDCCSCSISLLATTLSLLTCYCAWLINSVIGVCTWAAQLSGVSGIHWGTWSASPADSWGLLCHSPTIPLLFSHSDGLFESLSLIIYFPSTSSAFSRAPSMFALRSRSWTTVSDSGPSMPPLGTFLRALGCVSFVQHCAENPYCCRWTWMKAGDDSRLLVFYDLLAYHLRYPSPNILWLSSQKHGCPGPTSLGESWQSCWCMSDTANDKFWCWAEHSLSDYEP